MPVQLWTPELREREVALAFPNTPEMVSIARCESGFHQFDKNGNPLLSRTGDYGILQVNRIWIPLAKKMGLDIVHSAEDNITMSAYILRTQGIKSWTCS